MARPLGRTKSELSIAGLQGKLLLAQHDFVVLALNVFYTLVANLPSDLQSPIAPSSG